MPVSKLKKRGGKLPSTLRREALIAEAKASNVAPLEFMLGVLNSPPLERRKGERADTFAARLERDEERRMDAAKAAAPYVHAKPIAQVKIEAVTEVEDTRPVNVLELAKQVAFLFTMAQARPELDVTPTKLN